MEKERLIEAEKVNQFMRGYVEGIIDSMKDREPFVDAQFENFLELTSEKEMKVRAELSKVLDSLEIFSKEKPRRAIERNKGAVRTNAPELPKKDY